MYFRICDKFAVIECVIFFQVNGQKMSGKSQAEAVNVLRSTRGLVKILVQREEKIQSPRTPVIEVSSVCTIHLRK